MVARERRAAVAAMMDFMMDDCLGAVFCWRRSPEVLSGMSRQCIARYICIRRMRVYHLKPARSLEPGSSGVDVGGAICGWIVVVG